LRNFSAVRTFNFVHDSHSTALERCLAAERWISPEFLHIVN
jgi:hypothetical protein